MLHVDVAFDIYLRRADGSGMQSCANIRAPPTNGDIRHESPNRKSSLVYLNQMFSRGSEASLSLISNVTSTLNFTADAAVQMSSLYDRPLRFKHS